MNRDVFSFDVNEELRTIRASTDQAKFSTVSKISSNVGEIVKIPPLPDHDEISNISRISSYLAVNQHFSERNKVEEIKALIGDCARHWGETDENIKEYITDQLATFPLDDLLKCFRSLNYDIQHIRRPYANFAKIAIQRKE